MRHGDRGPGRALLVVTLAVLAAGCSSDAEPAADPEPTPTPTGVPMLVTPADAGEWARVTTDAALDNAEAYLIRAEEEVTAGTTPLFAEYERDDGATLAFLGFNVEPDSAYGRELAESPEVAVDVALADAGILDRQALDAGDLGGALACGTLPPEYGVDGLTCAWADATTTAQVTLAVPDLDYDEAGALTREFREGVTER